MARDSVSNLTGRSVVIAGPNDAAVESTPVPPLKLDEVLIRVAYEGVCATDIELYAGTLGYYESGMAKYPIVPGHEFSGTIIAAGAGVSGAAVGARVVVECIQSCGACAECLRSNFIGCALRAELGVIRLDGGYADYVVVPGRFVHALADSVGFREACLCEPLAVVLKGLKRLSRAWSPEPGPRRCAVIGAGPLGHLVARVLAFQGHQVTVFDHNPVRRGYFEGTGIEASDDRDRLKDFDVLAEVTGDPGALHDILHRSSAGSTILLLGLPYSHRDFTFESIVAYDKTVVGSVGSSAVEFDEAIRMLSSLDVTHYLKCVLPLEEFRQAWLAFHEREFLKILLQVDPRA